MARWFERYPGPDQMVFGAPAALNALETKLGIPAGQGLRDTAYGSGFDIGYLQMNEDLSLSASWAWGIRGPLKRGRILAIGPPLGSGTCTMAGIDAGRYALTTSRNGSSASAS